MATTDRRRFRMNGMNEKQKTSQDTKTDGHPTDKDAVEAGDEEASELISQSVNLTQAVALSIGPGAGKP